MCLHVPGDIDADVSVAETIILPNQPNDGQVIHGPMGGDGYTSPLARYEIDASLLMDSGGGTWRIAINLDPQYLNVVSVMQLEQDIASDTTAFAMDIKLRASNFIFRVGGDLKQLNTAAANAFWSPPPMIDPLTIDFRLNNIDGDTGRATATVYLFKKGAQHIVPIERIMQCLVRSGTVT